MTNIRQQLSRYYWINVEVERQTKRRERLQRRAKQIVSDSVRGSMIEYPYIERVVKIEGNQDYLLDQLQRQIDNSIAEGLKAKAVAEEIIQRADDPRTREILRSRFVDCLAWESVGKENHIAPRQAQRLIKEFISKVS